MSEEKLSSVNGFTPNLMRRCALKTLAIATQLAIFSPLVSPVAGLAQASNNAGSKLPTPPPGAGPASFRETEFLTLSVALTGHISMDSTVGMRLLATLSTEDSSFPDRAAALARQTRAGQTPQQLLTVAKMAGLHDVALAIVAGWYTGTVTRNHHSTMVAYADSLMYLTVADGLSPPTYCANGPLWWEKPPPAARVSTPAEAERARLRAPVSVIDKRV
jgi:hypothetical protein